MARPKRNVNAGVQRIEQIDRAAGTEPAGEAQAEAVVSRPKRPLVIATRNRLTVPGLDHKNFHYHWFSDKEGNIEWRLEQGYTFVVKEGEQVGDRDANYSQSKSSLHTKPGGLGVTLYLMKMPLDLYEEYKRATSLFEADERERYIKEKVKSDKGLHGNVRVTWK